MATGFEELQVLQAAELVGDNVWNQAGTWDSFARETVGPQLVRAVNSIGANIAEAFGRFHYGDKLQFLYYACGSLFETKYWLNRALARRLITTEEASEQANRLTFVACWLNAFAARLKAQRRRDPDQPRQTREAPQEYTFTAGNDTPESLIDDTQLAWLLALPSDTNLQAPISTLSISDTDS